jgi:regulator of protease activity HflC (stomatin/prohibitin superfamily)
MELETSISFISAAVAVVFVLAIISKSIVIVPQERCFIVERLGKWKASLGAGMHFVVPILDNIAGRLDLREIPLDTPSQAVITKDNISLTVDGVAYYRIVDAKKALYGVNNYEFALAKIAQTTLRNELGKLELDKTFEDRESINSKVTEQVNAASEAWGIQLLRYEIKDITPPESVMASMEKQMKAEREKRALLLESEGRKLSEIAIAEGEKQAAVLEAEGRKEAMVLSAKGQAEAVTLAAEAAAKQLELIGSQLTSDEGRLAMQFELNTRNIDAKRAIAKESTVVVIPDTANDMSSLLAQSVAVSEALKK